MSSPDLSASKLRELFLTFFKEKGHKAIPHAFLVPENDPTVLFTTAGMHPLTPYLLGEDHPEGRRLCAVQPCLRTDDIEEVGNETHLTFFEMLGNWSLGDPACANRVGEGGYWKKEAIEWSWEFLTSRGWLGIDKSKLAVSVFKGDTDAPFDGESYEIWRGLGVSAERIAKLPKEDNWWGPAGETGPCGPDTEMFVWTGEGEPPKRFDPTDKLWLEIWNDVFMEYNRQTKSQERRGKDKNTKYEFKPLSQKNVDTGMGLERMLSYLRREGDIYKTELFWPLIRKIEEISGKQYGERKREMRVIADHIKAAAFILAEGVAPSNKLHGYIARRLIRRAIVKAHKLEIKRHFAFDLGGVVIDIYQEAYPLLIKSKGFIQEELGKEEVKFGKTIEGALRELKVFAGMKTGKCEEGKTKWIDHKVVADDLFNLFQTYGMPLEVGLEEARNLGIPIITKAFSQAELMGKIQEEFDANYRKHRKISRAGTAVFKGGLSDARGETIRLHTAAHLLHAALRKILGEHVLQKGSNITAERLRFDFSHPAKLTRDQIRDVEEWVNSQISKDLPVEVREMALSEAKRSGALGVFDERYGDRVKVYTIAAEPSFGKSVSQEICGGPHVSSTGELGRFRVIKEEASSAGVRRIKAVLKR